MNLHSLQQLNQDFNGAVVALLEAFISGQRLCFYTKGCTFPAQKSKTVGTTKGAARRRRRPRGRRGGSAWTVDMGRVYGHPHNCVYSCASGPVAMLGAFTPGPPLDRHAAPCAVACPVDDAGLDGVRRQGP